MLPDTGAGGPCQSHLRARTRDVTHNRHCQGKTAKFLMWLQVCAYKKWCDGKAQTVVVAAQEPGFTPFTGISACHVRPFRLLLACTEAMVDEIRHDTRHGYLAR